MFLVYSITCNVEIRTFRLNTIDWKSSPSDTSLSLFPIYIFTPGKSANQSRTHTHTHIYIYIYIYNIYIYIYIYYIYTHIIFVLHSIVVSLQVYMRKSPGFSSYPTLLLPLKMRLPIRGRNKNGLMLQVKAKVHEGRLRCSRTLIGSRIFQL